MSKQDIENARRERALLSNESHEARVRAPVGVGPA